MSVVRQFFNPELNKTDAYTERYIAEKVQVRDLTVTVTNHYWQDQDGHLWTDFGDPMENLRKAFSAYIIRKGWLTPYQIRSMQRKLHLSDKAFSSYVGIDVLILNQIKNNHRLQTAEEECLLERAYTKAGPK